MKEILISGAMALMLMAQQTGQPAQQQKDAIPDAPRPQLGGKTTLAPNLGPIAPGSGTTASSNGDPLPAAPEATTPTATPANDDSNDPAPLGKASDFNLPTINAYSNFVEIPFLVKDNKGRLVPGLEWRDVRIYENGVRQHPSNFTVDPFPLSVALVIDNSLDFKTMARVNSSIGALQAAFTPYDEISVFTYDHGPRQLTVPTGGQSPRLTQAIEQSKATGHEMTIYAPGEALQGGISLNGGAQDNLTPLSNNRSVGSRQGPAQVEREVHTLNDGIFAAAQSLSKAARGRRRIIYVISDGKEYGSNAKAKDVIRYCQSNNIGIYATLVGDSTVAGLGFVDTLHLPLMMRDNILPVYTKATGGEFYAEYRQKGIETSFARITEEVRTQYTVGYYSTDPITDPKFRPTEVRVLRPNLTVIAKRGYYPTPQKIAQPQAPAPATSTSTPNQ